MNARFYVPGIGRFASADTIVPDPMNPQTFNRYSYVDNKPLMTIDPTGHNGCSLGYLDCDDDGEVEPGYGHTEEVQEALAVAGQRAGQTTAFLISFVPGVGEAMDVFDIGAAIVDGNLNEAAAIAILTAVPGRASAVLDLGADGLKKMGLSDEISHGLVDLASGDCSFSADTPVMTEDGLKSISEVELYDKVLAYDEETGEIGYYPILAVWAHFDPVIVELTIDGELIETTPEHPFYTATGEWISAGTLEVGDLLRQSDWSLGIVESVSMRYDPQLMYNFTVSIAHTYFVGEGAWLVHNDCWVDILRKHFTKNEIKELVFQMDSEKLNLYWNDIEDEATMKIITNLIEKVRERGEIAEDAFLEAAKSVNFHRFLQLKDARHKKCTSACSHNN